MVLNKSQYFMFIEKIKQIFPQYVDKINKSLQIDNVGYEMGFLKEPTYTFDLEIDEKYIDEYLNYVDNLSDEINASSKQGYFDEEKYAEYDDLIDLYNIIKSLKQKD